MKKLLIFFVWLPAMLTTLSTSLFFYSYRGKELLKESLKEPVKTAKIYQMYTSHPKTLGDSTSSVKGEDAIPELVSQYLERYNSPMADTAYEFTSIFREYSINPIIPLAIAQCESNLGSKMPSEDCNNPFGLGIHSKGRLCFDTWEEGYEKMAGILKKNYIDKGYITIEQIMEKYCPISAEAGGSWAKCVNQFTQEIETLTVRRK